MTLTLQRVGNHFVCPLCREHFLITQRLAARSAKVKRKVPESQLPVRTPWLRFVSLSFLAIMITGFLVVPTFVDPSELKQEAGLHARTEPVRRAWAPLPGVGVDTRAI